MFINLKNNNAGDMNCRTEGMRSCGFNEYCVETEQRVFDSVVLVDKSKGVNIINKCVSSTYYDSLIEVNKVDVATGQAG